MPQQDAGGTGSGSDRQSVKGWAQQWAELDEQLKSGAIPETVLNNDGVQVPNLEYEEAKKRRRELADKIVGLVETKDHLWDVAVRFGFNEDLLDSRVGSSGGTENSGGVTNDSGGGDGTGSGGGGKGQGNADASTRRQARDNRLLGTLGKEFRLVKTPNGMYVAEYVYRIQGEVIRVGVKLGKSEEDLRRFGLKPSDAKDVSKEQAKRIQNIGWAGELAPNIRKGDKSVFKSLSRYLTNQYGGQAILNDDEVMAVVIANSMLGWSAGEFENRLRQTSWYQSTNEHQRMWTTQWSQQERDELTSSTLQDVVNFLESNYGRDWTKYIEGGMDTANKWAKQIASGRWGAPDRGFDFWSEKRFDHAKTIENTPAWIAWNKEQEQINADLNRPEDMLERLREEAMYYLGQANGKPLVDRDTLKGWATDLISGVRSDADWQRFLRQQMRALHPYFDENVAFTDQASSYKSMAESLTGTSLTWDDPLMMKIQGTDPEGKPTGQAMALYDYAQWIRDNDPRFWQNPQTESKGLGFLSELSFRMSGVR